jgi:putative transcriptional regulator
MTIKLELDLILVKRKVTSKALAQAIGVTEQNLSILKTGKAKGVRFSTLDAICAFLNCEPGEIIKRVEAESP